MSIARSTCHAKLDLASIARSANKNNWMPAYAGMTNL